MDKKILIIASALLVALIISGCAQPTGGTTATMQPSPEKVSFSVKYTGAEGNVIVEKSASVEKGANAFEEMRKLVTVDFDNSSYGIFVKKIANTDIPQGYYLALYVNREYATQGISSYALDSDTSIEWKTEKLDSFGAQ